VKNSVGLNGYYGDFLYFCIVIGNKSHGNRLPKTTLPATKGGIRTFPGKANKKKPLK